MLIHLLGDAASAWRSKLRISDDINVFEKKYTYVDQVELQGRGISFKLNPRPGGQDVEISISVRASSGKLVVSFGPKLLAPVPPSGGCWIIEWPIVSGSYNVRIVLEGCNAFEADLLYDDLPF